MNGQSLNSYGGLNYNNMPMMNLAGTYAQSAQQGRNLYQGKEIYPGGQGWFSEACRPFGISGTF